MLWPSTLRLVAPNRYHGELAPAVYERQRDIVVSTAPGVSVGFGYKYAGPASVREGASDTVCRLGLKSRYPIHQGQTR